MRQFLREKRMIIGEFVLRRKLHLLLILVLFALPGGAAERWEMLPPTPGPIHSERSGQANANGISIHYAVYGQGLGGDPAAWRPGKRTTGETR